MALLSGTDSHASSALLANFLMCVTKDGQCHRRLAVPCRGAAEPAPLCPLPARSPVQEPEPPFSAGCRTRLPGEGD